MWLVFVLTRCCVLHVQVGWTALMLASANGHPAVVELLLKEGADKDAKNKVSAGRVVMEMGFGCRSLGENGMFLCLLCMCVNECISLVSLIRVFLFEGHSIVADNS